MIRIFIIKELKEIVREGRFKATAVLLLLLFAVTIILNYQYQLRTKQEREEASLAERTLWESQPDKNPHNAAHYGIYVFKPVYPLSILDPGVNYYNGITLYLEAHRRNSELFSPAQDATSLARFGDMRPAFVLLYLFPLFIILLGYNMLSKERETKTLSLLLAQGVSKIRIMLGKWIALSLFVLLFYLPVIAISALLLKDLQDFRWSSFLFFHSLYLLYYFVFINLVLLASAIARRSGAAFILLLLFWMISTVLLPKLFSNIAEKRYPLPTNEQMAKNIAEINKRRKDEHTLAADVYKKTVDSLLQHYAVDSVEDLPVNMGGISLDIGEQYDSRNTETQFRLVNQQLDSQEKLYQSGGWLSPFLSARLGSMQLAGTNEEAHWRFTDSAEQYRRLFVGYMNRNIAYESGKQENYKASASLWKSVPAFQYKMPDDRKELPVSSFFSLTIWLLLTAIALAFFSTRLNSLA